MFGGIICGGVGGGGGSDGSGGFVGNGGKFEFSCFNLLPFSSKVRGMPTTGAGKRSEDDDCLTQINLLLCCCCQCCC